MEIDEKMRLFLVGYMGAGKTTIGKLLAKKLNYAFVDVDWFIENRYNQTISKIFEEKGEAVFREIEHRALIEISSYENVVVSTGGGLPCFFNNMELMNRAGTTVYLKENVDELAKTLNTNKQNRPLIKNLNFEELQIFIKKHLEEREPFYNQAKHIINVKQCVTKHEIDQWIEELFICL